MQKTEDLQQDGHDRKSLEFYIKKRDGKKRDYIFDVAQMKTCPHNHLHAMVTGGTKYRCEDCNWCFDIVTTYAQPLHNVVVGSLLQVLHFGKEFGGNALQEVLRTPKGQHELDYHLPALPEGMTFWDAVEALDQIDVNTEDRGAGQLRQLFEEKWVPTQERQRRHKELGADNRLGDLLREHGLMAPASDEYADATGQRSRRKVSGISDGTKFVRDGAGAKGKALPSGHSVPSLPPRRKGKNPQNRDS